MTEAMGLTEVVEATVVETLWLLPLLTEVMESMELTEVVEATVVETLWPLPLLLSVSVKKGCDLCHLCPCVQTVGGD